MCKITHNQLDHPVMGIFENEQAFVFLDKYPVFWGHTLVVPRHHCEQVVSDFTHQQYIELQSLIYQVAKVIQEEVQPERIYILSLGSQTGNCHVHWHIVPHPQNAPYNEQELIALRRTDRTPLAGNDEEMRALAARIRKRLTS